MDRINVLLLFVFLPYLSLSQNFKNSLHDEDSPRFLPKTENIDASKKHLKDVSTLELIDWKDHADRKVKMFYKYLSHLIDSDIDNETKTQVAALALDLFIDNSEVCDSILLGNKQQIFKYSVSDFLMQMIEFDKNNVKIDYNSNHAFFDIDNTATRTYNITELITFAVLSEEITYSMDKVIVVHFIENPIDDGVKFIVKLGNISFSK